MGDFLSLVVFCRGCDRPFDPVFFVDHFCVDCLRLGVVFLSGPVCVTDDHRVSSSITCFEFS